MVRHSGYLTYNMMELVVQISPKPCKGGLHNIFESQKGEVLSGQTTLG